jgi:3-oxoadipate enol-lactonase
MGTGPAVVLVHGYPLDGAMWSGVARALAARFRVLKLDLPGHGDSPAPPATTIDEQADFLEACLAALPSPAESAGLAAFSMGGYAALALARRRPQRLAGLALVDTRATADDAAGREARDRAIATVRERGAPAIADEMVPRLLSPAALQNPDLVLRVRRIILRQPAPTIEADLAAMRERPDRTSELGAHELPTLIVVGEQDTLTPPNDASRMAGSIAGSRLVTIEGAGHLTPMEKPGAVAKTLEQFFGEVLRAP